MELLYVPYNKHPFKLTIKAVLSVPLPEFMLELENCLRRETHLKTENSPDMNQVKDGFPISNLSIHFPV